MKKFRGVKEKYRIGREFWMSNEDLETVEYWEVIYKDEVTDAFDRGFLSVLKAYPRNMGGNGGFDACSD